ncbi:MAG: hypothetical protein PHE93_06455 [Clostridia bacterium]|nr:hypothetical protein [Clostridia bacterium]
MQTIETVLTFCISNLPSAVFALSGYFIGHYFSHYFACNRYVRTRRCEFILDELDKLALIIDESFSDIAESNGKKDFMKLVLNRQRRMNRKVVFVSKLLEKYVIDIKNLSGCFDEIKSFLTGDEFSSICKNKIDEQEMNRLKTNILGIIDNLKWDIIAKF